MRKISFAGIELTSQRVRGLRGTSELPGRLAYGGKSRINQDNSFPLMGRCSEGLDGFRYFFEKPGRMHHVCIVDKPCKVRLPVVLFVVSS